MGLEKLDAPFEHLGNQSETVIPGKLEVAHDQRGHVGIRIPTRRPAPASVGVLHLGEVGQSRLGHAVHFVPLEDGVPVSSVALLGPLSGIADLLRIQIGDLLGNALEVDPQIL